MGIPSAAKSPAIGRRAEDRRDPGADQLWLPQPGGLRDADSFRIWSESIGENRAGFLR